MRMILTTTAVLALLLGLGALGPAAADDAPGQSAQAGHWLYEVRIVRVDPGEAGATEAGSPFAELKDTTVTLPWSAILKRLKARGKTTVLMDTRVNALDGVKSMVSEETSTPITALNFHDRNNEQYRSQLVKQGCSFEQTTSAKAGRLQYLIQVRGTATPPQPTQPPTQYVTSWNGTHAVLEGATLVLEHRRQVAVAAKPTPTPAHAKRIAEHRNDLDQAVRRVDEINTRLASIEKQLAVVARNDTVAKLQRESAELMRAKGQAMEDLADRRKRLANALEAARAHAGAAQTSLRAIEHYAFVTGRYVAPR